MPTVVLKYGRGNRQSLDRLPTELIEWVLLACDHASLKNLRLVNSRWRDVSTPLVFEHLYVALLDYSFANFNQLARSKVAKYVKKVTVYSDIIPDWDQEEWETKLASIDIEKKIESRFRAEEQDHRMHCAKCEASSSPCAFFDRLVKLNHSSDAELEAVGCLLEDSWKLYVQLVREQNDWREDQQGLIFKESFALLPNVSEASVTCAIPFKGKTNMWPIWKTLHRRLYFGPDDWMYVSDFRNRFTAPASGQAALCLLEAIAFRASFSGTKQITKLNIDTAHLQPYQNYMGSTIGCGNDPMMPQHMARCQAMLETFRHLTDLRLNSPHAAESAELCGQQMANEAIVFLRTAKHLRRLDLVYDDPDTPPALEFLFDGSNGEVVWPHLEHLSLSLNVQPQEFLDFLRNHSATLRSLELRDMTLHQVRDVFTEIPRILKLSHVYVECVYQDHDVEGPFEGDRYICMLQSGTDHDAPYEKAVKGFLLGECETLPDLEIEDSISVYASDEDMFDSEDEGEDEDELANAQFSDDVPSQVDDVDDDEPIIFLNPAEDQ